MYAYNNPGLCNIGDSGAELLGSLNWPKLQTLDIGTLYLIKEATKSRQAAWEAFLWGLFLCLLRAWANWKNYILVYCLLFRLE